MKKYTKDEWLMEGENLFGPNFFDWEFECPSCGHVQSVADFRKYKDDGATPDSARSVCIGRYDGHMDAPIGTKPGPCNYTSGGLLNINPNVVVNEDGREYSVFAFAK